MNDIIIDFKNKCNNWDKYTTQEVVFNASLETIDISKVKYILVGDNPGKNEKVKKKYLIGTTGVIVRCFFEKFLVDDFDKEVVILNKTPISTNKTKELEDLKDKKILEVSQLYMANLIYKISSKYNIPVIIMGISSCRGASGIWNLNSKAKKSYFCCFFKQIKYKFREKKDKLFFIKHFSRNSFFADFDIEDYKKNPKDKFYNIGINYREEFFKI